MGDTTGTGCATGRLGGLVVGGERIGMSTLLIRLGVWVGALLMEDSGDVVGEVEACIDSVFAEFGDFVIVFFDDDDDALEVVRSEG